MLADIESEHIILTHFSRRYTPELIRQKVYNYLPPEERSRVQLFL
jgi:ribonuclease BN (tRNA processing enzyme)